MYLINLIEVTDMWKLVNKNNQELEILSDLEELLEIAESDYGVEVIQINYEHKIVKIQKSKQEW